jgi:hypothetical protein
MFRILGLKQNQALEVSLCMSVDVLGNYATSPTFDVPMHMQLTK